MSEVRRKKRTRSRMKTIVPIVVRPWNRCGVTANKSAIPPVLMVRVNHLSRSSELIKKNSDQNAFKGA